MWCLRASNVRRLPAEPVQTCLPRDALGPFLARAWEAWLGLDDRHKGRLRGVVNLYAQLLASIYPIQQIALTAMCLERFRELVLGNETVLEKIDAKEKGFDEATRWSTATGIRAPRTPCLRTSPPSTAPTSSRSSS